jgi:hypothetical protein
MNGLTFIKKKLAAGKHRAAKIRRLGPLGPGVYFIASACWLNVDGTHQG